LSQVKNNHQHYVDGQTTGRNISAISSYPLSVFVSKKETNSITFKILPTKYYSTSDQFMPKCLYITGFSINWGQIKN
jgi:hypothetical protein